MTNDELKDELMDRIEPSHFAQEVTVYGQYGAEWVDIAPYEVEEVLRLFQLVNYKGDPTEKAKANGLPGNEQLAGLICEATDYRHSMVANLDLALQAGESIKGFIEPIASLYGKAIPELHGDLDEAENVKQYDYNNARDFGSKYAQKINEIMATLKK